jgi:hypothetical protein
VSIVKTGAVWTAEYIRFVAAPAQPAGRKTAIWYVENGERHLGRVSWFSAWRCYAFFPAGDTVFEKVCLRDIAEFCEDRTTEHKTAAAARKQTET